MGYAASKLSDATSTFFLRESVFREKVYFQQLCATWRHSAHSFVGSLTILYNTWVKYAHEGPGPRPRPLSEVLGVVYCPDLLWGKFKFSFGIRSTPPRSGLVLRLSSPAPCPNFSEQLVSGARSVILGLETFQSCSAHSPVAVVSPSHQTYIPLAGADTIRRLTTTQVIVGPVLCETCPALPFAGP